MNRIFSVAKGLSKSLLGHPKIPGPDLIKRIALVNSELNLSSKSEFPSFFRGSEKLDGEYKIKMSAGVEPFSLSAIHTTKSCDHLTQCSAMELGPATQSGYLCGSDVTEQIC